MPDWCFDYFKGSTRIRIMSANGYQSELHYYELW